MQVHGVKKDEIQLQIASGQMQIERADSNHSEAKYDPGMLVESRADQGGHETGLLSIRPGQQHEMLVRQEDQVMTTQKNVGKKILLSSLAIPRNADVAGRSVGAARAAGRDGAVGEAAPGGAEQSRGHHGPRPAQ